MWYLYLLYHTASNHTYIGVTKDVWWRLQQHRGERYGGAKATTRMNSRYPDCQWELVCFLEGFDNRSLVCTWEKLLQRRTRGIRSREKAMHALGKGEYPDSFPEETCKKYEMPTLELEVVNGQVILSK